MTQADLKSLQAPLLLLAFVMLVAAGAIYYAKLMLDQAEARLAAQEKQLIATRIQLQRSGIEKQTIEAYIGGYYELARGGFVGGEQRISWLDGLRVANQRADLFGVDYQIGVQRPYSFASELNPGSLQLRESIMRLRFRLLHEADLMRFFAAFAQTGGGMFAINECGLQRIDTGGVIRVEPHLTAECELAWITADPGTAEKKP